MRAFSVRDGQRWLANSLLSAALLLPAFLVVIFVPAPAEAALNAEQRKELLAVRKELLKVPGLIRKKSYDEARSILDEQEKKVASIAKAAMLPDTNSAILPLKRLAATYRGQLDKADGKKPAEKTAGGAAPMGGVSFSSDVAPILTKNCTGCHSTNPSGGLKLDTFAGMEKGGSSGPLLTLNNSARSLIVARLTTTGNRRMPKDAPPLTAAEIRTISRWIDQGAKFDGSSKTAAIGEGGPKKPDVKVTINRPSGNETVSFKKDIAPFMVNLCLNCHNNRRASSGFSLETFDKMMQGGKSGRVIIPGNLDASRMWDLVGKQDPIKMPMGQARITRTNWRNLQKWIEEGAKFDGDDPKDPLRKLVPTEEEIQAAKLAKLTDAEFGELRKKRSDEAWEKVLPREKPQVVESKEFMVYGNVTTARLEEVAKWAEEHGKTLRTMFGDKSPLLFKGRLTIFVVKDRFSYTEFNQVLLGRDTPREMMGHFVVSASYEDSYLVLQDIGDTATEDAPGLKVSLIDHLTSAMMSRGGSKLPDWVLRGTGLALAAKADPNNVYIKGLREKVPDMLKSIEKPEEIFSNGTFSPSGIGAVGYALVDYMLRGGGPAKFGQFIGQVQRGSAVPAALQAVYQTDAKAMALAFGNSLGKGRPRKR